MTLDQPQPIPGRAGAIAGKLPQDAAFQQGVGVVRRERQCPIDVRRRGLPASRQPIGAGPERQGIDQRRVGDQRGAEVEDSVLIALRRGQRHGAVDPQLRVPRREIDRGANDRVRLARFACIEPCLTGLRQELHPHGDRRFHRQAPGEFFEPRRRGAEIAQPEQRHRGAMTRPAGAAMFLPGERAFQAVRGLCAGQTHAVLIARAGVGKSGRRLRARRRGGCREANQEDRQHGPELVLCHRESYSLRS